MTNSDHQILLCSDLDRTLLPNGPQEESPGARVLLRILAGRPEVALAYVSGRHRKLLLEAIEQFDLPVPDYAVGDVGTTIYQVNDGQWLAWKAWEQEIAPDWRGMRHDRLASLFEDMEDLELQEAEKQNSFKLSYYAPEQADFRHLIKTMHQRLDREGLKASLIWSVDEAAHKGLLDVLPEKATKYHAIRFLMKHKGFAESRTVFAGDSGNDLPALTSGLQAVLVRNAREDVRREARQKVRDNSVADRLYCARGGFKGMNGNYASGVLEGLVHFIPEAAAWME